MNWRQKWAIGIYAGPSPLQLSPDQSYSQPVFTAEDVRDVPASSVADPFLFFRDAKWHLFFELWNTELNRGEIGCATSPDAIAWTYQQVVLREPFHLSYPCVFEWNGDIYMTPETRQAHSVRLYKANPFPFRWNLEAVLVEGQYADATPFVHGGRLWMFAQRGLDELRLFGSDQPGSGWREHPSSPIKAGNRRLTRPGGRVIHYGDRLLRFAQDGLPSYGYCLRALEIETLTASCFVEKEIAESPILKASGSGWNGMAMHHADVHMLQKDSWLAAVDGATLGLY